MQCIEGGQYVGVIVTSPQPHPVSAIAASMHWSQVTVATCMSLICPLQGMWGVALLCDRHYTLDLSMHVLRSLSHAASHRWTTVTVLTDKADAWPAVPGQTLRIEFNNILT